jgi:hypothetical protein
MRNALRDIISEHLESDCDMNLTEAYKLAIRDIKKFRKQLKSERQQILAKSRYNLYNL